MAYTKQTWTDGEVITKEKLDYIEDGISTIELTPGPKGDKGDTGAAGPAGPKGADATIPKLTKMDALATDAAVTVVVTELNKLIADLKAKGYMTA